MARRTPRPPRGADPVIWGALAVALGALGATAWVLGEHDLRAWLRLLGGALVGSAAGATVLVLLGGVLARRRRALRIAAGAVAVLAAVALTVPAILAHRGATLDGRELAHLAPLGETDRVVSVPALGHTSPVLVLRAAGGAQLVSADGRTVTDLGARKGDAAALTADGRYVLVVHGGRTRISPVTAARGGTPVAGEPVAAAGPRVVLRVCDAPTCTDRAVDPAHPAADPAWSIDVGPDARTPDPERAPLPGPADPAPTPVAALRAAGILPATEVRYADGQGWFAVDPATGFLRGRRITGADEPCRVVAPWSRGVDGSASPVLAVCTGADGAVTVSAHRDGSPLWQSAPSAAGRWSAVAGEGRAVLEGTAADGTVGQLVASEAAAAWAVPGTASAAGTYRALVGMDGRDVVRLDDGGTALDHDLVTGELVWTLPTAGTDVRGALGSGTTVLVDDRPRTDALDPRGARRLRVVDGATGHVTVNAWSLRAPDDVRPIAGGRALVQRGRTLSLVGLR